LGSLKVVLFLKKNLSGFNILSEFFVDAKSFIVELILVLLSNLGKFLTIIIVESIDVIHYSALISLNCSQDQQVLEISVVGEA
jgi:hypothetical protein